jgi:putative FmdB family regulatory protein
MSYSNGEDIIVLGDVKDPGHDFRCASCAEIFEVHYRRDKRPGYVICPICGSGETQKLIAAPAIGIRWRNAAASSSAADMVPKYLKPTRNRAARSRAAGRK